MQLQSKKSFAGSLGFTMMACIWTVCAPALAAARTIYVAEPGQGGHVLPYTNWPDAATNIQAAIDEAGDGDTVLISNGTYYLAGQLLVSSFKTNIAIRGLSGAPEDVVIDANNYQGKPVTNRCMIVNGNQILLEALTFTNGRAVGSVWDGYGGALLTQNSGKTSLVENCRFVGNIAINGGGVGLTYGTVTLRDCVVRGNAATNQGGGVYVYMQVSPGMLMDGGAIEGNRTGGKGGGIYVQGSASYAVDYYQFAGSSINSNDALDSGGGAYCYYKGAYFSNAYFYGNAASNNGGGLYYYYGGLVRDSEIGANQAVTNYGGGAYYYYGGRIAASELSENSAVRGGGVYFERSGEILNSILWENTAADGGGIYFLYGGLARGCLLTRNTAAGTGGGILQWQWTQTSATSMVESCTIVSNSAATAGGGLYLRDNAPYTVKNYNNIIWFNGVDSGTSSNVYNYDAAASNGFYHCAVPPAPGVTAGQGNRTDDPRFVDWAGGNFRLADGSPCINAGTNMPWMLDPDAVDAEGRARLDRFSRLADIGCYEYVPKGMMFWLR